MARIQRNRKKQLDLLGHELLSFYDEFTEQNACVLFAMQAFAAALACADAADQRSVTGAMFWIQRLNDRALDLEQRLRDIQKKVHDVRRL